MELKEDEGGYDNYGASLGNLNERRCTGSNDFILILKDSQRKQRISCRDWFSSQIRTSCTRKNVQKRVPILNWLPKYDTTSAVSDLIAGITIGLTVIPQALAYSSIVGVPVQNGLYSSFIGCFIYIVFGSAKDVAIGPTATIALVTHEAVGNKGLPHVILLCFLSGWVQILMGVFRLGFLIDFISGPVSSGFASAAALIIVTSQVNHMLGIQGKDSSFIDTWINVFRDIHKVNLWDAVMGFSCLAILLLMREAGKVKIKVPNKGTSLGKIYMVFNTFLWLIGISRNVILVIACSVVSYILCEKNGEAPFGVTGFVPAGLPHIKIPPFGYTLLSNTTTGNVTASENESLISMITDLGSGILVVALVGLLEDIAVCKAFGDGKAVDATQEFLVVGLSNVVNSFVQAFPITGALARSAVNRASGVKTTMGNLYTGFLVIIALMYLTPYFYYIPKATLAAIIIAAAIFMVEVRVLKPMWRVKRSDLIPGLATFIFCLILPLQYGILIGIGINIMFILYHAARPKISLEEKTSPQGVNYLLLTPDRCVIFPSAHYVKNLVTKHSVKQKIPVVIDCTHIYGADFTAATVIKDLIQDFLDRKEPLFFFNLKPSVGNIIEGLSPQAFFVYYNRELFDELLERWRQQTTTRICNI